MAWLVNIPKINIDVMSKIVGQYGQYSEYQYWQKCKPQIVSCDDYNDNYDNADVKSIENRNENTKSSLVHWSALCTSCTQLDRYYYWCYLLFIYYFPSLCTQLDVVNIRLILYRYSDIIDIYWYAQKWWKHQELHYALFRCWKHRIDMTRNNENIKNCIICTQPDRSTKETLCISMQYHHQISALRKTTNHI